MHHSITPFLLSVRNRRSQGSTLILVLFVATLLSFLIASTFLIATNKSHVVVQTASWQEALAGAESGGDLAMAALNKQDWTGWFTTSGTPPRTAPAGANPAATGVPATGSYNYLTTTLTHAGEGNNNLKIYATVDAPASLNTGGRQWFRVRATGSTDVPGGRLASMERLDADLRKISFVTDRRTGTAVAKPQSSRTVEIIVQPSGYYAGAIATQSSLKIGGGGFVDSMDSSDPTKSTLGLYNILLRQSHGDIVSMDSTLSDLKKTYVYGKLDYGGAVVKNTNNVQGAISAIAPQILAPISDPGPSWTATDTTVTAITNTMTLIGGTKTAPARYKVSSINLAGGTTLTLDTSALGQQAYVEIWVTGNFTTAISGLIIQQPGVNVTYYVDGDITLAGSSFENLTNAAASCVIYGVTPPTGSSARSVTVSGAGIFIGVINAPSANFNISGLANFTGALIGNSMDISGGASIHFDEALNKNPTGSAYVVASWFDDID